MFARELSIDGPKDQGVKRAQEGTTQKEGYTIGSQNSGTRWKPSKIRKNGIWSSSKESCEVVAKKNVDVHGKSKPRRGKHLGASQQASAASAFHARWFDGQHNRCHLGVSTGGLEGQEGFFHIRVTTMRTCRGGRIGGGISTTPGVGRDAQRMDKRGDKRGT